MTEQHKRKLTVEIWSDLACPWCWIGMRRFTRALERFEHAHHVDVVPRAFRLERDLAVPVPLETRLAQKYGLPPAQIPAMLREIDGPAATEGITFRFDGMLTGDTIDSHRLIKLAAASGKAPGLTERLYHAYFSGQTSLFERDNLLRLAEEEGMNRAAAEHMLDSDRYRAEVNADQQQGDALGISGVPFFLFGNRYAISGAQPAEIFVQALTQAWDEQPADSRIPDSAACCGADGCAVPERSS